MPLPQEFLLQLHDRTDIVELVGGYVSLRPRGRTHTGLCPFHNEKTPSFVVYPHNQSFYCFGCGVGGDIIGYVMRQENLEYIEAVRLLADRAGLHVPQDETTDTMRVRRRVLDANRLAARFFYTALNSEQGMNARAYLRGRGLSDATIKTFGIGYADDSWGSLRDHLNKNGYRDEELVEAGLCSLSTSKNNTFDFFKNRIMFPVIDVRGNVIAFSGRALADDPRKYLNSRDTPAFKKSRTLFALNIAKNNRERRIILAEGQMDVIAIHQAGFDSAVAAMGTALSDEHTRLISQYADEVVLCYDSDDAGKKAAGRAIEAFKNTNILVRVIELEDAKDPDEYIKKKGADHFRELIVQSGNSTEYLLGNATRISDLESDTGRIVYLDRCAAILARVPSPTERDLYAGRIADKVGVTKAAFLQSIEQVRRRQARQNQIQKDRQLIEKSKGSSVAGNTGQPWGGRVSKAEEMIIALLFHNPDTVSHIRKSVSAQDFASEQMGHIFTALCEVIEGDRFHGYSTVITELDDEEIPIFSGILAHTDEVPPTAKDAEHLIKQIKKKQDQALKESIKSMSAVQMKDDLMAIKKKRESGVQGNG